MYKVIESFADIQDNRHVYKAGDSFPRGGVIVSEERIAELSSDKNRRGKPLIEKAEEKKPVEAPKAEKVEAVKEVTAEKPKTANRGKSGGQKRSSGNNTKPVANKSRGKKPNAD